MASSTGFIIILCVLAILLSNNIASSSSAATEAEAEKVHVLTLDHSNFSQVVSQHKFIVVDFYAPWCDPCKSFAPKYEKAASVLSSHDPPVALAKVDGDAEVNKELVDQFGIEFFPTIKILKNGGEDVQDYKGALEANGIVDYVKNQVDPASSEIKTPENAGSLIDDNKIFVVPMIIHIIIMALRLV